MPTPVLPKLHSFEESQAYTADNFTGLPVYNKRHGKQKFVITSHFNGAVKKARSAEFHSKVSTLSTWSSAVNDPTMDGLWEILDEL